MLINKGGAQPKEMATNRLSNNNLALLQGVDRARTQSYHVKVLVITAMGLFAASYNTFCLTIPFDELFGRLYYYDPAHHPHSPGILPRNVNNLFANVLIFGALTGQLVFSWLGDKLGRKKVYGITLIIMVICSILSGLSLGSTRRSVIGTLSFFRFWVGFGIGGVYPLTSTVMSEYANKKTRGAFIAAVFAMHGVGMMFGAGLVPMILSSIFLKYNPAPVFKENPILSTQPQADYLWRIVLMLGAIPALLSYFLLMKMPETGRYTALVKGNARQAAVDMAGVFHMELEEEEEEDADDHKLCQFRAANNYPILSSKFYRRHGLHLISIMSISFLLGMAYYSQTLTIGDIYHSLSLTKRPYEINAIEGVYQASRAFFIVALIGAFPGYWFTVRYIDTLGRFYIQLVGFLMMSILMLIMGIKYEYLRNKNQKLFVVLHSLTFFFTTFGPSATTFVLESELFPTRFRSTCHGLSATSGKTGAIIAEFVLQSYTNWSLNINKKKNTLMILAAASLLGFGFTFLLPETKSRSLEEISGEVGWLSPGRDSELEDGDGVPKV